MASVHAHARRIQHELRSIQEDRDSHVSFECAEEGNLTKLIGTFDGPEDTPYEGGVFKVLIELPPMYPMLPPKCRFLTRVWHPNISSQTGAICLDILKDKWSPALSIRTVLISLSVLLAAPVPEDPQDGQVAGQYLKDFERWKKNAKLFTTLYAAPPEKRDETTQQKFQILREMGFSTDDIATGMTVSDSIEEVADWLSIHASSSQ